ncbi:hypothetical protein [Ferruginibacter sp.]
MKQALILGSIIIIATSFTTNITTVPKLSLTAMINERSSKHITLKIILTNNTADTIKYESWDCSWQDSYTVDNDKWKVLVHICFTNGHKTFEIPPYRSINNILELDRTSAIKTGNLKFKIGFHYIPHQPDLKNIPGKMNAKKSEDFIVWSNTITPSYFTKSLRW